MTPTPAIDRQLWIGPPGCGLTRTLLRELIERLRAPGGDPARMCLLVPDHAAVTGLRRRLLALPDMPAIPDGVLTPLPLLPARLGVMGHGRVLTPLQERLLIRQALVECGQPALEDLLPPHQEGVIGLVIRQIRECKAAGFLPASSTDPDLPPFPWREMLRHPEVSGRQQAILEQFQAVWMRYEELKNAPRPIPGTDSTLPGWLDPTDTLREAIAILESEAPSPFDWVGIDGFSEFTAIQWRLVRALMQGTATVRFTLNTDQESDPPIRAAHDPRHWFAANIQQSIDFTTRTFNDCARTPHPALTALRECVPGLTQGAAIAPAHAAALGTGAISWWEPKDRAREVSKTLRDIRQRVQAGAGNYREHLIVVRDVGAYRPLLERESERLAVPLELARSGTLLDHPLGQRWLGHARLAAGRDWSPDRVLPLLRLGEVEALNELAAGGHCLAQLREGIQPTDPEGWAHWLHQQTPEERAALGEAAPLLEALCLSHAQWQAAESPMDHLQQLCTILDIQVIAPWRARALNHPTAFDPAAESAVASQLILLAEACTALGGTVALNPVELLRLALSWEPLPQPLRQREAVRVVELQAAGSHEAHWVYVLGMLAGEWPRRPGPELIFTEPLRLRLSELNRADAPGRHPRLGAWTRPDWKIRATHEAIENWLLLVACTRAREHLVLSAPQLAGSQPTLASQWFVTLRDAVPAEAREQVLARDGLQQLLAPVGEWVEARDGADWLAAWAVPSQISQRQAWIGQRQAAGQLNWGIAELNALGAGGWLAHQLAARALPTPAPAAMPLTHLPTGYAPEIWSPPSASRLRTFAECPFRYFAQYACRLEAPPPPAQAGMHIMDQGSLMHAALEHWVQAGSPNDPDQLATLLDAARQEEPFAGRYGTLSPLAQLQWRTMHRTLRRFLAYECGTPVPWQTAQIHPEWRFGYEDSASAPPLTLDIAGRRVEFRGSIDRLELATLAGAEAVVLYDYKYSAKGLSDHEEALHKALGVEPGEAVPVTLLDHDLQLPLYAIAAWHAWQRPVLLAAQYPLRKPAERHAAFLPGTGSWAIGEWSADNPPPLPTHAQMTALEQQLIDRIASRITALEAGTVATQPLLPNRCGPGRCDFAAVCRYEEFLPREVRW